MMNIGLFSPNYPGVTGDGGIGTYTRELAIAFRAAGHNVAVLTGGQKRGQTMSEGVPIDIIEPRFIPVLGSMLPGVVPSIRVGRKALQLVDTAKLEIFEFPNWEGMGLWFALRRRVPLVVRLSTSSAESQAIDAIQKTWSSRSDVAREAMQSRLADALVTHSRAHRTVMAQELGVPESRITVIPLGVEVQPGFVKNVAQRETRKVVFLGRLERRKGVLELLKAVPLVVAEVPSARFLLIGPDRPHCPGGRYHKQYFEEEFPPALHRHVMFAGSLPHDDVTRHLQEADLFVAPSLYESFGLVFLEAMRWGTPVVGTSAGGIPEIVESGRSGVLVPPEDERPLASAIVDLLKNDERRRALGAEGKMRVETLFSVASTAARTLDLYTEVLARHAKARRGH